MLISFAFMKNVFLGCLISILFISCENAESKREKYFALGNTALQKKRYERAIDFYTKSLKWDNQHSLSYNNRAVAKSESDHIYEAILGYNQALLINPDYADARLNRAYAYEKIGKYKKSIKDVELLINQKKDSAFLYFYKGIVLVKMRSFDEALASFTTSDILEPQNPETLINLANVLYLQDKLKIADSVLNLANEVAPNNPNALNLSSLIASKQGNFQLALSQVNAALDTVPNDPYFLNNRGYIYLQLQQPEKAIKDINQSILYNSKNGWAYRNKGIYYYQKAEYMLAVKLFERATKSIEFVDEVYSYLGKTYKKLHEENKSCLMWKLGIDRKEKSCEKLFNENCAK